MARALEAVKDRELRAQIEKQSRRRVGEARSEARGEADAAVVAHLSESQADLGVAAETARPPALAELVPGARVRVRGFSAPVVLRRRDGSSAEVEAGPLRMKVPLGGDHRHRDGRASKPARSSRAGAAGASRARPRRRDRAHRACRRRCVRRNRRNQRHRLHGGGSHAARRQIPGHRGAGRASRRCASFTATAPARCAAAWRNFSPTHPLVERIHAEADERGGAAVTVVELEGLSAPRA